MYVSAGGLIGEMTDIGDKLCAEVERLESIVEDLTLKHQQHMQFYDDHVGTPCEQIRWANERERLLDKIEVLKKELAEAKEPVKDERIITNPLFYTK